MAVLRGELVGAAEDDLADEGFDGPIVFDKAEGEVVEEFGVAGEFAGLAKIVGGADEALAEKVFPKAVDDDTGGEWVLGIGDPAGEFEAAGVVRRDVGGGAGLHDDGDETAGDFGSLVADLAPDMDVAVGDGVGIGGRHRDDFKFLEFGGEGFEFFLTCYETGFDLDLLAVDEWGFERAWFGKVNGIGDDVVVGAFGGDCHGGALVFGEGEGADTHEAAESVGGLGLVDFDSGFSVRVVDCHRNVGGAVGPGAVGNEDFVFSGRGQSGGELDLLLAFEEVVVVEITFADPRSG